MTADPVQTIIKIGQPEHITRLQKLGEVYLNTWGYFRRLELNDAQGDKHEGLTEIFQAAEGHQLHILVGEEWVPIGGLTGQLKFFAGHMEDFNLYCMFALTPGSLQYLNHPDLLKFGDSALVFTDGDEFVSRLTRRLEAEGIFYKQALVEYVEKEVHEGEMGPFRKLLGFSYQSEWRICARAAKGSAFVVSLGDLSDISIQVPTCELMQRFQVFCEEPGPEPTVRVRLVTPLGPSTIESHNAWQEMGDFTVTGPGAAAVWGWLETACGAFGTFVGDHAAPQDLHYAARRLQKEPEDGLMVVSIEGEPEFYISPIPEGAVS